LRDPWLRSDEWYGFRDNPRPNVTVLLSLDEASYAPGDGAMGADHPIAWYHEFAGGRAIYTGLGHTVESYRDEAFKAHLEGAIRWASGAAQ
jgi:type 1 glutamine amidotransferase